jgi:hypothetical protein
LWQLKQLVLPTGTCVTGLPVAVLPLWQLAQLVLLLKVEWSTLAPDQVEVVLWQLSQLPVTLAWMGVDGLPTAGGKPPVWQVAQALETLKLGVELRRRPGAVARLVAAVAVGRRAGRHRQVRDVVRAAPVGRRVATGVAARALASDRQLRVVPLAGQSNCWCCGS